MAKIIEFFNESENVLIILVFSPLIGAFLVFLLEFTPISEKLIKIIGLIISILIFFYSLSIWISFNILDLNFQFMNDLEKADTSSSTYYVVIGLDGLSLFFILLTTFLIPACLLNSWHSVKTRIAYYIAIFLLMESILIGVFIVLDILLFYILFEAILIPMFLVIGIWGARQRKIQAAYQFFLYTLFGSVLMLIGLLVLFIEIGTTDVQFLMHYSMNINLQLFLWLAFFASFAIKIPMIPVHIWLPEAHVEAPTAGSVLLAGVLLKLGTYGFLRFSLPLFPDASIFFSPIIFTLSIIAIIYTSLTTLRQIDLKKIIAYSSVGHMNFVTLGLFSFNIQSIVGSILVMISHGIISSALFLCIGIVYDRYHTRIIKYYRGLTMVMPLFTLIFLFFTLANISVPGTGSFIGEFLILLGSFQTSTTMTTLASIGMILGAAYSIWLYNRVSFGYISSYISHFNDISYREFFILLPFIALVLIMGIYPDIFLIYITPAVSFLLFYN